MTENKSVTKICSLFYIIGDNLIESIKRVGRILYMVGLPFNVSFRFIDRKTVFQCLILTYSQTDIAHHVLNAK